MARRKIERLQQLARDMVGDSQRPDLFFVSDGDAVVLVSRDFAPAYAHWTLLSKRSPRQESSLENRSYGTIACVEPDEDGSSRLIVIDNGEAFAKERGHGLDEYRFPPLPF